MSKQKLIKVSEELYEYIAKIAISKYGRGKSMPYYLYLMANEVNYGKRRRY